MESISRIVLEIINLPQKYNLINNKSIFTLLIETGYLDLFNQVSEMDIYKALNENRNRIIEWLQWSDDKKYGGWYFTEKEGRKYIVAYYPSEENNSIEEHLDITKACASFIKKEIEYIRKSNGE